MPVKNACKVTEVIMDPKQRVDHVKYMLRLSGLRNIEEKMDSIYCAVPLSDVPENKRALVAGEHDKIKACIAAAGLSIYDPKDGGMNPWVKITDKPVAVYDADTHQVVTPRYFEFSHLHGTSGGGMETEKAINFNKVPVIVTKSGIYTSRMVNGARRAILIEYYDANSQQAEISEVFLTLKRYDPGIGKCSVHGNTLLGFSDSEAPVCLPGLIADRLPNLVYNFDKYKT